MSPEDFTFYKTYLDKHTGLALTPDKTYLLETRLSPVVKKWDFSSLTDMTVTLRRNPERKLLQDVIDAMVTNETMFFRDERPFTYFRDTVLPSIVALRADRKSLRIWSAACSTGQEPYSIAMSLAEIIPDMETWNIEILATDISDTVLKQARTGKFNQFEIQRGLPPRMMEKYFVKSDKGWTVCERIRKCVRFENFNLLDRMTHLGIFDMILCRNVLMYFSEETKQRILANMVNRLSTNGFLFMGTTERVKSDGLSNVPDCPGLYASPSNTIHQQRRRECTQTQTLTS